MEFNMNSINWEEFKKPPKSARPMVRWWWPGLDVEKDELIKEVNELDEAGFYGAELQVFAIGLPWKLEKKDQERAARIHRFMQPYYYEMVKIVLDEASSRDMIIDLTIGSAWPAGGVHISKEDSLKVLLMGQKVIKGGKNFQGKIPKFRKPITNKVTKLLKFIIGYNIMEFFRHDMKLEALIAAKVIGKPRKIKFRKIKTGYIDESSLIDLTDNIDEDFNLNWNVPEGKWQIFSFFSGPSGARPLLDCRSDPNKYSLVLDHFSSSVIKKHLDLHLGVGKNYFGNHFGKTLRAFFTDSLELSTEWFWTENFLDYFNKRRGYDLKTFLPISFVPNRDNKYTCVLFNGETPCFDFKGDIGKRIRYDFELTISDLFSEEFCHAMMEWAKINNLKSRIQTYGIRADTLKAYGASDIPETEQLYSGGIIDFLKFAASGGILYEKQIITAESIVWNQRDYATTPLKWKVAADRLFVSGINQMIYHGFPYQNNLFPYPGYCGFSTPYIPKQLCFSSNFSRMNPFWEFFPIINQYITRCQYILQHGKVKVNIGIYYPLFNYTDSVIKKEELVGGYLDEFDAPTARRQVNAYIRKKVNWTVEDFWTYSLIQLTDLLMANGYNYIHINEECLLKSKVEKNQLILGTGKFEVLIINSVESISVNLAQKLKMLADEGFKIIFIEKVPTRQNGFLDYQDNDKIIQNIMNELVESNRVFFIDEITEILDLLRNSLNINPGIKYDEYQPTIYYIHKETINSDYYFLRNSVNQPKTIKIRFPHLNRVPFLLDPWSGNISQAAQYKKNKNDIELVLYFEAYGSFILEFKDAKEDPYIIKSPISIKRVNNSIFGYSKTSGEFLFYLSDRTEKNFIIEAKTPESIFISCWHFITKIRDYLGHFTLFETDFEELKDWREIPELKFCSSKGIYYSTFTLSKDHLRKDLKIYISMARVHDVAVVKINDIECPPLMRYPYNVDITSYVRIGENSVEIEVTPTLRNRLIGYGKKGGKNWKNHKRKKEFMPSGLIGPIKIEFENIIRII